MRIVRAFIWLRWRLLVNAMRGGRRRDRLEQISRALSMAMPVLLVVLSLGSVFALAVLGFLGGRALGAGPGFTAGEASGMSIRILVIVRVALAMVTVIVVFFAFWLPIQSSLSRYTRLLLLPISRRMLHGVEFAAAMADPWIGFIVPALAMFALGLFLSGRAGVAAIAAAAGLGLLLALAGLASLIGFLVSWLFRSRRRSELFTLVFVLALSLVSLLPALVSRRFDTRERSATSTEAIEDVRRSRADRDAALARWLVWTRVLPSQHYANAVRAGFDGNRPAAGRALGWLGVEAVMLFVASSFVHGRLIGSVESDRKRRRGGPKPLAAWRIPLAGPAVSAVAAAQVRTAVRSVRGRLSILLPGPLIAALSIALRQMSDTAGTVEAIASSGHLLLGVGILFTLYSFQAFTMNLFGSDRSGLSLQFLLPIGSRDLALGKLAGMAIVMAMTVALCLAGAAAVSPTGPAVLWIATLLGGAATYLWLAPVFIWLSALFPVAADLSKTGSGGNPHGLTMIVGTLLVPAVSIPAALIVFAAQSRFAAPWMALPLMLVWLALAAAISLPLVTIASRTIGARSENLALVAQGR
jgi:hypothetical protein